MKKILWICGSFCVVVLLVGAVGVKLYFSVPDVEVKPNSRMVKLFQINSALNDRTIVYPGRIEAKEHANLFFRVSGPVIENSLELGMSVKKGDVLMRIDPRDYEREVDRLTHDLAVMKAKHVFLELEFKRMDRLLKSNATSRSLYESALSTKDASEAEIKSKETALKIARDKLSDTRLIAPFEGRITRIGIEKFEMAKANEIVVSLQNLEKLEVVVNVPEGNIPEAARLGKGGLRGKKYPVLFPGRKIRMEAELTEFSPAASIENGTYELRLTMTQPENAMLFPGMTAEVRNLPGRQSGGGKRPCIPFSAVFRKGEKSCVWRYDPKTEKLSLTEIRVGAIHDNVVETDSLPAGSWIAAAGGDWLTEGVKVNILNPEVLHESR